MNEAKRSLLSRAIARQHLAKEPAPTMAGAEQEDCPSDSDLVSVALKQGQPELVTAVEKHAQTCEHCAEALEAMGNCIARKSPPLEERNPDPVAAWLAKGGGVTKTSAGE